MDPKEIEALREKYLKGECNPEEEIWIEKYYLADLREKSNETLPEVDHDQVKNRMWNKINNIPPTRSIFFKRPYSYVAAASILLSLGIGYYFLQHKSEPTQALVIQDVAPGGNRAVLTLSNGSKINLDAAANGKIAQQADVMINKTNQGEVVYVPSAAPSSTILYNTIATPKGGQFIVQLPDGSKVWLNAASSIKFPSAFNGADRKVTLDGEAYFEISKDKRHPFIVETPTQTVQVLGTHFNINSYQDELAVKTTLLEGAVRIFSTQLNLSKTLIPGQQAIHQNNKITIEPADETAVAWKEGKMRFKDVDLPALMRQVSRWYDVTIKYEGPISNKRFNGGISRSSNLSELLRILEGVGIHFRIENQNNGIMLIVKD